MHATRIDRPAELRHAFRTGVRAGHTSGLAPGFVQGNVAIVPGEHAAAFATYCQLNAQACPVLAMSAPGDWLVPALGDGIDIRSDLPAYRVYRHGAVTVLPDVTALWQADFVTFVIGCSFTFEQALMEGGVQLRHVQQGRNVAMYRTNIATQAAGPFGGGMVVSMRPIPANLVERACTITARFADQHGAPIHVGDPAAIGITDLQRPEYGDSIAVAPGEVPVFWACGVTSQAALEAARLPFFIAHAPGCMLITDRAADLYSDIDTGRGA